MKTLVMISQAARVFSVAFSAVSASMSKEASAASSTYVANFCRGAVWPRLAVGQRA